jgi:peroxiredoxin
MIAADAIEVSPAPQTLRIGAAGPPLDSLLDVDGRRVGFADYADRPVLVLIFSSNRCPTAKAYAKRMNAFQHAYGQLGVQLLAINSNDPHLYPTEDHAGMIERAATDGYTFPYLVDEGQHAARAYGATCTFHVFVLDSTRRLRYQGRFDDARIPERVTSNDLANAVDDLLAGRDVRVSTTRPFGCSLDFV